MVASAVYYHNECPDGLVGAAVVHMALTKDRHHEECSVVGIDYYNSSEDIEEKSLPTQCQEVYFVDYCPSESQLLAILGQQKEVEKITIIDHHKGSLERGNDLSEKYGVDFIFDDNESGASLAFRYFYPEQELPEVVKDVRDVDLWIIKRPISLGFSTLIRQINCVSFCKDLLYIGHYRDNSSTASALYNYLSDLADKQAKTAVLMDVQGNDSEARSLNINCKIPVIMTDASTGPLALMRVAERFEGLGGRGLALGMYLHAANHPYKIKLSLRSTGKVPCLDIARELGGNGHTYAAGALVQEAHVVMGDHPALILNI